jgi:hypothetical protein
MLIQFTLITLLFNWTVVCRSQSQSHQLEERAHVHTRQEKSSSRISINPNPCDDLDFSPPLYIVSDIKAEKRFLSLPIPGPTRVAFRLHDTANGYVMICNWNATIGVYRGREGGDTREYIRFSYDCTPKNDSNLDRFMNRFLSNVTASDQIEGDVRIDISQIWICQLELGLFP